MAKHRKKARHPHTKKTLLEGRRAMAKHRKKAEHPYVKRAAIIGSAAATATAMTVGMPPPSSNAAASGPNYTQIITNNSNSLNNMLFIAGNLGGGAANLWNPVATAIPGGLLPTFTAGTTQNDLTSIAGLLAALASATNLAVVPGLPANATTTILAGLVPGLGPVVVILGPLIGALGSQLGTISGVLNDLSGLSGGILDGVPTLEDLLGLTATQTTFNSTYNWPLLGLGPLLGLQGSTTISNTFAQLPSLTASSLVSQILGSLNVAGLPISSVPGLPALVAAALAPLDGIATPSVTAWIPAGTGTYGLPLGGSIGWLATMPTLDVGPIAIGPIVLSDTDTVVAIPIFAAGAVAPLGLAQFGTVSTPGVVFPTATGVSTLGGTSLTSFSVPLLGFSVTNLNILSATYVGTNGINYNSGQSVLLVTTPFFALPIVYSLGSFNVGTTGFGFTLPSLFGIGLLPPFQVGTPPTQQSPDGLIPADLLNLGLALGHGGLVPTQAIALTQLLGLPDPGSLLTPVVNPLFNSVVAPIGSQITNLLNGAVGPLANGFASLTEQLTAVLAQLSGAVAGGLNTLSATPQVEPLSAAAVPAENTRMVTLTAPTAPTDSNTGLTTEPKHAKPDDPATNEISTEPKGSDPTTVVGTQGTSAPKHAAPDPDDPAPPKPAKPAPKNPLTSIVRSVENAFAPGTGTSPAASKHSPTNGDTTPENGAGTKKDGGATVPAGAPSGSGTSGAGGGGTSPSGGGGAGGS